MNRNYVMKSSLSRSHALTSGLHFAAIADAVRTSLGPRGMDKMVGTFLQSLQMMVPSNL